MKAALLALALVASLALASATSHVLYTRTTVPDEWSQGSAAAHDAKVEFTLALRQRNLDILEKWFLESSDPTHKNYQAFKSIDEIRDLVSPVPAEHDRVLAWLKSAGVHSTGIRSFGDAIDVRTTVKHAAKLFKTSFYEFKHSTTGAVIVRQMGSYSVPAELRGLVEMVAGISTFPIPHLNTKRLNASNDYGVIPQTVDTLYQVSQEHRALLSKAKARKVKGTAAAPSQAVIEFQGENFAESDLQAFAQGVNLNVQQVPAGQIVGPNDQTNPQTESSLDIQMIASVDLEATNWFWLENGNGWLYQFATHFFSTADVPQINSISYGWWEGDQCDIDSAGCQQLGVNTVGYVQRVNVEFQKIGLRGISLLSASGDSGANGRTNDDCSIAQLRPAFPGSSPWVTTVGATELTGASMITNAPPICSSSGLPCAANGQEQAVSYAISQFASGGGFSAIAPRPSYQAAAVEAYFNSGVALPPASYYNASGRGMPDLAAIGHNLLIVQSGAAGPVGGTSASTPIVAAIFSLLNAEQLKQTGKPLGFLNPLIYKMYADDPTLFHDITIGDNKCTEDGCSSSCEGYLCTKGWDPVTGLGTPNFAKMLTYIKEQRYRK